MLDRVDSLGGHCSQRRFEAGEDGDDPSRGVTDFHEDPKIVDGDVARPHVGQFAGPKPRAQCQGDESKRVPASHHGASSLSPVEHPVDVLVVVGLGAPSCKVGLEHWPGRELRVQATRHRNQLACPHLGHLGGVTQPAVDELGDDSRMQDVFDFESVTAFAVPKYGQSGHHCHPASGFIQGWCLEGSDGHADEVPDHQPLRKIDTAGLVFLDDFGDRIGR